MSAWPEFGTFTPDGEFDSLPEMAAAMRELGLTAMQIGGNVLEELVARRADPGKVRTAFENEGVRIAGVAGYSNLVAPDLAVRKAKRAFVKRCLEIAPALGEPVVATETGSFHPDQEWFDHPLNHTPEAMEEVCRALDELLPVAEASGSVLALEAYVNNVLKRLDQVDALLDKYRTNALALVCDPYNYISADLLPQAETVAEDFFTRFGPKFAMAHLKDVGHEGAEKETPEYGTGVFPQRPYLRWLKANRPDLPLILEHLPFANMGAAIARVEADVATDSPN